MSSLSFSAVIPAAGIGKRVGAEIPKQYLTLLDKTIIEHSLTPFLNHAEIKRVVVVIADNDCWFQHLDIARHPKLSIVDGGKERVDSVLNALKTLPSDDYVLVHDAARPCIQKEDIDNLLSYVKENKQGVILAHRVRDTMKRSDRHKQVEKTVERENLWHALTPQLFNNQKLIDAITKTQALHSITDEASAIEMTTGDVFILEGRSDNLKITQPEDLLLAEFYLSQFNSDC